MWWSFVTVILYWVNLTTGEQPKIVIVGAGASGIAAASKLYENGFQDVTILEAENRIGGRVYTTWFDESWVDLGGQWVNGQTNNIAFELAEPLGLLEVAQETQQDVLVYNSKGCQIPTAISNNLFGLFAEVTSRSFNDSIENTGSVGDYFTGIITAEATKLPEADGNLVKQFLKLMESLENLMDASDSWYDTSASKFSEYAPCPGQFTINWKDKGYGTILDVLMKKYPNPENELPVRNNTKLNTEVVKIDYNSTEGKVLVESSNGEKYTADHVIFTPSLGVLKEQYETLFDPELPESKIKTIKSLSMGTIAKIYLSFEAPWWPENSSNFSFVWNDIDKQEYENDPHRKWLVNFFLFSTVAHRPRLLCGWLYGSSASYMETLSEDQVLRETFVILKKFLGKTYNNITTPTGISRSTWHSNKHFRGSYSFRSMESDRADVWASGLAAPIMLNDRPIVLFAGEATNSHRYACVHGAIETGFREANRLVNLYNKNATESET